MSSPAVPQEARVAPEAVRSALETLLASAVFAGSTRASRFLRYVVEESLAGRADGLKEYRIGLDVFDRSEKFDPKTDPVVRVEARQLRFKLDEYYSGVGRDAAVVISVPKGGYVPQFALRAGPTNGRPRGRWVWMGSVILICLAAVLVFRWRTPGVPESPSVVVLPLVNQSGDPADDYLSSGLTDGLTGALSRVKALRVIAGASAEQMLGSRTDIRKIGQELNVSTVLDGQMARDNDRVRITVRLLRTSDASVLMTRTWQGSVGQVYVAQAELAGSVAEVLRAPAARFHPVARNREAQDYYLRARYEADQMTRTTLTQAIAHYENALRLDPQYAAAWYGLAVARHRWPVYGADGTRLDRTAVEAAYRKAADADPNFPEPHTGLALIAMQQDWDWDRAEKELAVADAIAPTAMAESHAAYLSLLRGRREEMDRHIRRARDLDPLGSAVLMNTAEIQMLAGEYVAARQVLERFVETHPQVTAASVLTAYTYLAEGRAEEALRRYRELEASFPAAAVFTAMAQARLGRQEEARRKLALPEASAAWSGLTLYNTAQAYGYLGDAASAMDALRRSADLREASVPNASLDPAFRQMRDYPPFQALLKEMHLVAR